MIRHSEDGLYSTKIMYIYIYTLSKQCMLLSVNRDKLDHLSEKWKTKALIVLTVGKLESC